MPVPRLSGSKKLVPDVLFRAGKAGVQGVQVHVAIIHHVAADHGALVEVDVVKVIDQPRRVIQVLRGAVAILQRDRIDDMHRSACRAEMNIGA